MSPAPPPKKPPTPTPRVKSSSRYDPTGIDDGEGGIPIDAGRPVLRWTALVVLAVVIVGIAALPGASSSATRSTRRTPTACRRSRPGAWTTRA